MRAASVSEACQINDLDHLTAFGDALLAVSEACQINDLDHFVGRPEVGAEVSEACQINDLDHVSRHTMRGPCRGFRSLSDQ